MYDARSTSLEFLDRPDCDPALSAESYRFMEMINFYFGGIRVVQAKAQQLDRGPAHGCGVHMHGR